MKKGMWEEERMEKGIFFLWRWASGKELYDKKGSTQKQGGASGASII